MERFWWSGSGLIEGPLLCVRTRGSAGFGSGGGRIVQEQSDLSEAVFDPSDEISSFEIATLRVLERNQDILRREEEVAIDGLLSPVIWDGIGLCLVGLSGSSI